jgi:hypothetical protein
VDDAVSSQLDAAFEVVSLLKQLAAVASWRRQAGVQLCKCLCKS